MAVEQIFTPKVYARMVSESTGTVSYMPDSGLYRPTFRDTRLRAEDPNWRAKIANLQDATNAYYRSGYGAHKSAAISVRLTRRSGTKDWSYFHDALLYGALPALTLSVDTDVRDIALKKLKRKLQEESGAYNSAVPLAQAHEVAKMVHGFTPQANLILQRLIELKRTIRNKRDLVKQAQDLWLTWSFGVSPTIDDINTAARALSQHLLREDHISHIAGAHGKTWMVPIAKHAIGLSSICNVMASGSVQRTYGCRYTAGVSLKLRSDNNYGVSQQFGLNFGSIIPAAWELVPYSWMIDYFTTVGPWLDDMYTSSPGTTIYVCKSEKLSEKITMNFDVLPQANYYVAEQTVKTANVDRFIFQRSSLGTTIPHRALRFKTTDEVGMFAINKVLNLASLLRFGRTKNRGPSEFGYGFSDGH